MTTFNRDTKRVAAVLKNEPVLPLLSGRFWLYKKDFFLLGHFYKLELLRGYSLVFFLYKLKWSQANTDKISKYFSLQTDFRIRSCFLFIQVLMSLSPEPRYQNEGFPSSRCQITLRTPLTHPSGPGEEHSNTRKGFRSRAKSEMWKCYFDWSIHCLWPIYYCRASSWLALGLWAGLILSQRSQSRYFDWVILVTYKITFKLKKTWK